MIGGRPPAFRLLLVGADALVEAWRSEFAGWSDAVTIRRGRFEEHLGEFDAIVSPGNSYGQMNGGIDDALATAFPAVQRALWRVIADRHHGYQPVGTAEVIETGDSRCAYVLHAPTMRIPMRLHGEGALAIYDAMWAALLAAERHNGEARRTPITTLACPGLGTGVGGVPSERAAQLMSAAYRHWRADASLPIIEREGDLCA